MGTKSEKKGFGEGGCYPFQQRVTGWPFSALKSPLSVDWGVAELKLDTCTKLLPSLALSTLSSFFLTRSQWATQFIWKGKDGEIERGRAQRERGRGSQKLRVCRTTTVWDRSYEFIWCFFFLFYVRLDPYVKVTLVQRDQWRRESSKTTT